MGHEQVGQDIWVLKRDGTVEAFDCGKLRGCLLAALGSRKKFVFHAEGLSEALRCYLLRRGVYRVSSGAVLEMVVTALRTIGEPAAAERLERDYSARACMRRRLTLHHGEDLATGWSKSWLVEQARARWPVGRTAARILAGRVERELVRRRVRSVARQEVVARLGELAEAYGLASPQGVEVAGSSS